MISKQLIKIAHDYENQYIASQLQYIANEYEDIAISEQIQDIIDKQIDNLTEGSYSDFVKAIQKPTRQNVMKYEKSIAPKNQKTNK